MIGVVFRHGLRFGTVLTTLIALVATSGAAAAPPGQSQEANLATGTPVVTSGVPVPGSGADGMTGVPAASAETVAPTFSDVADGAPFFDEIEWAAESRTVTGYADGTFRPTAAVSRQAMAAFLFRLVAPPDYVPPGTASFTDVPVGSDFFTEIEWLVQEGITSGYDDGTFRPTAAVSRQAMATFLYRVVGPGSFEPPPAASFTDVPEGSAFATQIEWLAQSGVTTGYDDGTFRPQAPVSRQATAAFLLRTIQAFVLVDEFEYELGPDTMLVEELVSVEVFGGEVLLGDDGNTTGTAPWSAQVVLPDGGTVPEPGAILLVLPGEALIPTGIAGRVVEIRVDGALRTVVLGEAALDEVFSHYTLRYTGPLAGGSTALAGGDGRRTEGLSPEPEPEPEPDAGGREVAGAPGAMAFAGFGPLECADASGEKVAWGGLDNFSVELSNVGGHFDFDGDLKEVWLAGDLDFAIAAEVGGAYTCETQRPLSIPVPLVPGSPLAWDWYPKFEMTASGSLGVEMTARNRWMLGFEVRGGDFESTSYFNPVETSTEFSLGGALEMKLGAVIDVGVLARLGLSGFLGLYGGISLGGVQEVGSERLFCADAEIGVEATAGAFLDVFFVRLEYELLRLAYEIWARQECRELNGDDPLPAPPTITTNHLADGTVGVPYSAWLETADGRGGAWTVDSGSLPPGLAIQFGRIMGTPSDGGTFPVVVRFTDTHDQSTTQPLLLTVHDPAGTGDPVVVQDPLPVGYVGEAYSLTFRVADGRAGTWESSGALPAGLTLLPGVGAFSGVPEVAGDFPVTVTFQDTRGRVGSWELVLTVMDGDPDQPLPDDVGHLRGSLAAFNDVWWEEGERGWINEAAWSDVTEYPAATASFDMRCAVDLPLPAGTPDLGRSWFEPPSPAGLEWGLYEVLIEDVGRTYTCTIEAFDDDDVLLASVTRRATVNEDAVSLGPDGRDDWIGNMGFWEGELPMCSGGVTQTREDRVVATEVSRGSTLVGFTLPAIDSAFPTLDEDWIAHYQYELAGPELDEEARYFVWWGGRWGQAMWRTDLHDDGQTWTGAMSANVEVDWRYGEERSFMLETSFENYLGETPITMSVVRTARRHTPMANSPCTQVAGGNIADATPGPGLHWDGHGDALLISLPQADAPVGTARVDLACTVVSSDSDGRFEVGQVLTDPARGMDLTTTGYERWGPIRNLRHIKEPAFTASLALGELPGTMAMDCSATALGSSGETLALFPVLGGAFRPVTGWASGAPV